jgi:hypothetical protein
MASSVSRHHRRYDIDWLRVVAVMLLIPFHTARIFDIWEPFYAKNAETNAALSYSVIALLTPWHMPLLFLLAGASTWFALGFRSGGQYARERFTRLLIPLLFGVLVVVPPQGYYALLTQGQPPESFASFLATYFALDFGDLSGYFGKFTPGHLWFILILHQTVIVAIGYYVVQWEMSIAAKFSLICVASFIWTLVGYEVIKRFNPTRWLFGMKPLPRPARSVAEASDPFALQTGAES